jgi:hypothetical protein
MHYRPKQTRKFRLLYSFGTSGSGNGAFPQSGIIVNGTIYGTTGFGGCNDDGIVSSLTKSKNDQWQETILYSFTGGNDSGAPFGQLIQDKQGHLYDKQGHLYGVCLRVARRAEAWFLKSHLNPG